MTSDGLPCFRAIVEPARTGALPPAVARPVSEFTWVNTMLGNVKNAIHGTYHSIHGKHLGRYLGAFAYRFNRRFERSNDRSTGLRGLSHSAAAEKVRYDG